MKRTVSSILLKATSLFKLGEFASFTIILWTLLIILSLGWNFYLIRDQAVNLATQEARANWSKDQAFRRWVTRRGGLYVKPSKHTPPNPYLAHLPYRDVETTDGMKLTLMNPAYIMSQMAREFDEMYGIKGRITGQVLLNPANKPDPWELAALKRFDQGVKEATELSYINTQPYLRLMKPMIMEQGCVPCHGHLGFKVGDVRGGVSISIPLQPYIIAAASSQDFLLFSHAGIWLLGLLGIVFFAHRSHQRNAEQQQMNGLIQESERQISDLLSSTAEGIYSLNLDGECTLANPACVKLLGFESVDELMGANMHKLTHHSYEDGRPCHIDQCNIYKSFKTNTEYHCDNEVFWRADGRSFPVEYWAHPIKRNDKVIGTVVTFIDISERLKTEGILRRSQKMDALGQLTSGIAHDFNNQLGIVNGYLEMLADENDSDPEISQWISSCQKANQRCTRLTRQLLNFSRQQPTNTELINLPRIINDFKELIQRTLTPVIDVNYEIADNIWLIQSTRGDLEDSLLNLVINARDAMPDGGQLSISLHNKKLEQNEFNHYQIKPGDYVVIEISDTGVGIPKDIQEHVFDPFFTTKDIGKGTGLGMSMVYSFVKRNQGYINLYSEVGKGTRISMYFPRSNTAASQPAENNTIEKPVPVARHQTILLVEDERDLRALASKILMDQGYNILPAKNAKEALEILTGDETIDLLFCDIVMPGGMNGYQLAEKARELRPDLPVQLTSGLSNMHNIAEQAFTSQFDLLPKPYTRQDLINCIGRYF